MNKSLTSNLMTAAPLFFILMWSTGHIVTKLGIPFIEPFRFLAIRFALSAIFLTILAASFRVSWPSSLHDIFHIIVAGTLIHAAYLGGVFVSIDLGLSAGALGVITGIQPILTAAFSGLIFREKISCQQWFGLILGLIGVALVVWEKFTLEQTPIAAFFAAFVCLVAITGGTIYQKKYCTDYNLLSSNAIQLAVSALLCGAITICLERGDIFWGGNLVFAIIWQVLILSVLSFSLFYWLLARGEAVRVTSLFYLMAPSTAIMGYIFFGEIFDFAAAVGMVLAILGFWLVFRKSH